MTRRRPSGASRQLYDAVFPKWMTSAAAAALTPAILLSLLTPIIIIISPALRTVPKLGAQWGAEGGRVERFRGKFHSKRVGDGRDGEADRSEGTQKVYKSSTTAHSSHIHCDSSASDCHTIQPQSVSQSYIVHQCTWWHSVLVDP